MTLAVEEQDAAWFGTGIHLCMAEFYIPGRKRGRPLLDTWQQYTKDTYAKVKIETGWDSAKREEFIDARKLGREMLTYYMDVTHGDPHWEVIAPERRFQALIPDPKNPKRPIVRYVGTWDLAVRDLNDGFPKLVDHKTRKALPSAYELAVLEMDDQAGPYLSLGTRILRREGLIGEKESIRDMEYNFLIKRVKDKRPQNEFGQYLNKDGTVSKVQPPPPFLRHSVGRTLKARNRQIQRIQDDAVVMRAVRNGELPILKNVTKDCAWCDFFELCQVDEQGGDVETMKAMSFRKHDPYADHREGAENSKTSVANKKKTGVR